MADDVRYVIPPSQRDRRLLASELERWPRGAMTVLAEDVSEHCGSWELLDGRCPIRRLCVLDESGEPIGRAREDGVEPEPPQAEIAEGDASAQAATDSPDAHYWEALLRFPNAPIYTTHVAKPQMYRFAEDEAWENYHTMRVVGFGKGPGARIKHIYLLHNGLNETRDITFHYRLAAWILNGREDAVCIIRPLPGHLTRYPFDGFFSETPLDSYLRDPMDLFRQFLRYVVETQWLLSALILHRGGDGTAGGRLLTHETCGDAAVCSDSLAEKIDSEWTAAFEFNESRKRKAQDANRDQYSRKRVTEDGLKDVVHAIRSILGRDLDAGASSPAHEPRVHTVGYSMGGFMAQAAFFAWPHVISSCTSLFAGGALRDLAPTDFANPEEWQTVLHALRYEFDSALADGLMTPPKPDERKRIAGLAPRDFRYFKRAFYEVFLQYYRGGYSSRLTEFSRRLLCVLGGDDPIVRTENVLDAGPPEGMTLFQIADLSHFPGGAARKDPDRKLIEREQRMFWMPEIGRIIAQFSVQAEEQNPNPGFQPFKGGKKAPAERRQRNSFPAEGDPLRHQAFEATLDAVVALASEPPRGWLLVSRNEIPPVFLEERGFRTHAAALHHSEDLIQRYVNDLVSRSEKLTAIADRTTILLPQRSEEWFVEPDLRQKLFSRSETPGAANLPTGEELREMYGDFTQHWYSSAAVYLVPGGEYDADDVPVIGPAEAAAVKGAKVSLTMLPDVWIGMSAGFCAGLRGKQADNDRENNEHAIVQWITKLSRRDTEAKRDLAMGLAERDLVALKVSAAEFNPRYRGHTLGQSATEKALRHWAFAFSTATAAKLDAEPLLARSD